MRILLDENVPVDIMPFLRACGHTIESVNFLGWKGIANGELLKRAASAFDLLITRDKDFDPSQAHSAAAAFGIVLLAIRQQPGANFAAVFERLWPDDPKQLIGKITRIEQE